MNARRLALVAACLGIFACAQTASAQSCGVPARDQTAKGWSLYRTGQIAGARAAFTAALKLCAEADDARTGLSYVALRQDRIAEAIGLADAVLRRLPTNEDALVARGMAAWRKGDLATVFRVFTLVQQSNPGHSDARNYLARIPPGFGRPPERAPLVLPDTVIVGVRALNRRFEVLGERGWSQLYIKGMNLGAALPGKHPSEFPDSATYAEWLHQMHDMGVNVVRLYTIHPPQLYQALLQFNLAHATSPIRIIHGVWTELPRGNDFDGLFTRTFTAEMRRVIDMLYGRADIAPRAGHASGFYTADVSRWVIAYIIGREWEPDAVVAYNKLHRSSRSYAGRFLGLQSGNAMEVWLARMCDYMIAYENDTYRVQRPIAYTSWPTLDPFRHATEPTVSEEVAIRRSLGEVIDERPREYDNDIVGLDATKIQPLPAFKAGWFVSYHAYPYYPDFMIYDSAYTSAQSSFGRSNYFGYLRALVEQSGTLPVLISEYGVPMSTGIGHLQPQGWHHGGHTEAAGAAVNARLTKEIAEAGAAGGAFFAWIDEWFKKNWVTIEFELPAERNRLWYNRLDAEQHYGVIALEAAGRTPEQTLQTDGAAFSLSASSDEAYLRLFLRGANLEHVLLGFDLVDPACGDFRWPGKVGSRLPVGLEFVLRIDGDTAQLLADSSSNPFRINPVKSRPPKWSETFALPPNPPAGFFTGRFHMRMNRPFRSTANEDGAYSTLRVITNRQRYTRDGRELPAVGYDRGLLSYGDEPDGLWQRGVGAMEVRIPWMLLNFTDPSGQRILQDGAATRRGAFGTKVIGSISIVAALRQPNGEWRTSGPAAFLLRGWEEPKWRARKRPVFNALKSAFEGLPMGDQR